MRVAGKRHTIEAIMTMTVWISLCRETGNVAGNTKHEQSANNRAVERSTHET